MYIPEAFKEDDPRKLTAFMKAHNFATLISGKDGPLQASHLPFLIDETRGKQGTLIGHMAKANAHWKSLDSQEVLVIFQGPHAYISPTWYEAAGTVPTWNYAAVHAYGQYHSITDGNKIKQILRTLVNQQEASMPNPWKMESLPENDLEKMVGVIVGFEIEITRLEGKWKLNQNHPKERREKAIRGLRSQGSYQASQVADLMEERNS